MDDADTGSGREESIDDRRSPGERAAVECACCDTRDVRGAETDARPGAGGGTVLDADGESLLEAPLPGELQAAMGRFLGDGPVETLGDWIGEVRERTGGGPIAVADLCHERGPTAHWGELDGERHHFACFYDAVVLAAIVDRPVDVGTLSPTGTVVEARATGDGDLTVDPPGTLVSFGIATNAGSVPDGDPTREDAYATMCPYVRAFPTEGEYRSWAGEVSAPTVAVPLEDATAIATALVE